MKTNSIYKLVVETLSDIVDDLKKWVQIFRSKNVEKHTENWTKKYKMASEYILGGSRKSGKTFTIYILSVIACMALNDTIVLIDRLRSNKRIDSFSQVLFIIFNLLNGGPAIRSISKGEMSITFHNNSIILFRSVYDPNGLVQMTGIPRKNYQLALLINEECNPYEEKWFNISSEAVTAQKQIKFRLFNTDTLKQHIVKRMQDAMPESEHEMLTKGYQKKTLYEELVYQNKDGKMVNDNHITKYYRVNYRIATRFLTNAEIQTIYQNYKDDPIRGRVARDGLNGSEGKRLYYNLHFRHFLESEKLSSYKQIEKLPYMLFKKYRMGIDEGYTQDMFVLVLWGITRENRAIRIEQMPVIPPRETDLNINEVSRQAAENILLWSQIYINMESVPVNIRVEWAGNGVAVKQEITRILQKSSINFTIDKAKKSIQMRVKKQVQRNVEQQPELEARAAIKNLMFGRNQMIFWNTDKGTYDEYFSRGRDEDGLIIDGNDHYGDADDYALIPEYDKMIASPPKITFKQELDNLLKSYRIGSSNTKGVVHV